MTSVEGDPTVAQSSAIDGQSDDRFSWRIVLFALGCEIMLTTLAYLERLSGNWMILAIVLLVPIVLVMIVVAGMGIVAVVRGRFKRAVSLLLAPLILASPFLFPIWPYQHGALELLRLYFNKGYYDAVIDKLPPAEHAPKVAFFDWGGVGYPAASYSLVYDESGEIALPDNERSQAWKDRVYPQEHWDEDHCATSTRHVAGHYYSMTMYCSYP